MLIGSDQFFALLGIMRICWIRGRLGGGKTLLGVAIMDELCKRGIVKGVISNIPTSLPLHPWREKLAGNSPDDLVYRLMHGAGILFDEAWTQLDNRRSMVNDRSYGAFARKLGTIWVLPSVIPLDRRVSYLSVERERTIRIPFVKDLLRFLRNLPGGRYFLGPLGRYASEVWIYRYTLDMGYMQETGTFKMIYPERYFGMYDTSYISLGDAGIAELWARTVAQELAHDVDEGEWYYDGDEPQYEQESTGAAAYSGGADGISQVRTFALGLLSANGSNGPGSGQASNGG